MTPAVLDPALFAATSDAKAWPFEEARRLIQRLDKMPGGKDKTVIFETGYGPSGLPHIGTFGEVARTTMVRHAFHVLTEGKRKTRLICFSDDMDGMRKIPDNVPDKSFLEPHLHKPLTAVPNPFGGDYASFGHHNNAMLRRFLDTFSFEYEFASATEFYKAGKFDDVSYCARQNVTIKSWTSCCRLSAKSGKPPTVRSYPFHQRRAACFTCP